MDIAVFPERLSVYRKYVKLRNLTEDYLEKQGYLKTDLPVLSPQLIPESYLEIFTTEFRYQAEKSQLYLTPSPELFLKRLLSHGIGDCFYLGKAFRNSEPTSDKHSFEFTMLELYKTEANYLDIAEIILNLLRYLAVETTGKAELVYNSVYVTFDSWERLKVAEAFQKYAGVAESTFFDKEKFLEKAEQKGYRVKGFSYEDIFSQMYVQEIEPRLGMNGKPTLLYDYPKEFAALAKMNNDGKTAQRFEFYIAGVELGDCYTELTDWKEQNERFSAEVKKRKQLGLSTHSVDKGFIEALKYGLVPCAGIAIGFERLAMIFTGVLSIEELKLITIK